MTCLFHAAFYSTSFYELISDKLKTPETERVLDFLEMIDYSLSYRTIRYQLANEELDFKKSPYHTLERLYSY